LAGCYGGPVFNILIGMGISLLYAAARTFPEPFYVKFDASSITSLIFLYISLISTLLIVTTKNFCLDKFLGYYLIMLYVAYTVIQFTLLMSGADN